MIYGCAGGAGTAGGALFLKRLALSIAVCLAVAGPWYLKNAGTTVNFAIFSSKYNELATGSDRVPVSSRAALLANDLAGAPLFFTIAASAIAAAFFRRKGRQADHEGAPGQASAEVYFRRMAWLGAGIAGIILLYPTYFDTRFLLPIWPVLAVAMGCWLSVQLVRIPLIARSMLWLGIAASFVFATTTVAREPLFPTYWRTTGLIDDLVRRFGVSNLLNVGNCAAWNVCKTGLMNELREDPGSCFVLHDLTRAPDGPRSTTTQSG